MKSFPVNMRLIMYNTFLSGVANNPQITKKQVCHHLGLKVSAINSSQQHNYKLSISFIISNEYD